MSRFRIIVLLVLGVAIVTGLFVLQYVLSLHSVKFTIVNDVTVTLYKTNGDKKETLSQKVDSDAAIQLQNGSYCAEPTDKKYDTTPICFVVDNKDISVLIDPNYSKGFLENLLPTEVDEINNLIRGKYNAVINGFVLREGSLYKHGEWYGGTLTQKVNRSDQGDVYRFLLKKSNDTWEVVAYPQIVLSKFDYPDIPRDVLSDVNMLVGIQGS